MSDVFYPYACKLDDTLVDAVSDQGIEMGVGVVKPPTDGQSEPRAIFTGTRDPVIAITTQSIAKALGKIGYTGLSLSAADPGLLYCQKSEDGGVRGGASKHLKVDVKAAFVEPVSISAGVDAPGTMDFRIICKDDLTNDPLIFTANQSLPADTLTGLEEYFAGPVKLNNTALGGVQNITLNFNFELRISRASGYASPIHISVRRRAPVIAIATDDAKVVSDYKVPVAIASTTNCYYRKGSTGGRVANATEEHISVTVNAGAIVGRSIAGADQAGLIEIHPTYDGTNATLVIDTTAAIA